MVAEGLIRPPALAAPEVRDAAQQQKDDLCGPFHAARVLRDAGIVSWDGEELDQDLIALRAGTTLPGAREGSPVPAGAESFSDYRFELPLAAPAEAGTSAAGLAGAIEAAAAGALRCVPLRGSWDAETVERLVDAAPQRGARLLANIGTGPLWGSRPPLEALIAQLDGEPPGHAPPPHEWRVGHFVELSRVLRGRGGALVLVVDSYPTLGWAGRYLQPPAALASAIERDDGREGGVLAVTPAAGAAGMEELAADLSLAIGFWDNGSTGR